MLPIIQVLASANDDSVGSGIDWRAFTETRLFPARAQAGHAR